MSRTLAFHTPTGAFPFGSITDGERTWAIASPGELTATHEGFTLGVMLEPKGDACPTCGHVEWQQIPPQSFDQMVERRWFVEVPGDSQAKEQG